MTGVGESEPVPKVRTSLKSFSSNLRVGGKGSTLRSPASAMALSLTLWMAAWDADAGDIPADRSGTCVFATVAAMWTSENGSWSP